MKTTMYAIIKKDFRGLAANRRLFIALLIVPLILTIVLPSIFLITIHFIPDDPDIMRLLDLLPETSRMDSLELTLSSMILNYILPVFFLVIPIMTASIMAASAFVGEKERHTLETLLYCPLTLKQIFRAKVWASFLLSMLVSLITFVAMFLGERGQIVLPKQARDVFKIKPGDMLVVLGDEEPEHPGIALMKEDFFLGIARLFKTALNMADPDGKEGNQWKPY